MASYVLIKELATAEGTIATFFIRGTIDFDPYPGLAWSDGLVSGIVEHVTFLAESKTFQIRFPEAASDRCLNPQALIGLAEQLTFEGWTLHGGLERLKIELQRR